MNFANRHIGPKPADQKRMLETLGFKSLQELITAAVPKSILARQEMKLPEGLSETEALGRARELANKNQVLRSFIGMGYYGTHTPTVIIRKFLENPGWYTAYKPYQAEISQGRMEALLNFQTLITDLTVWKSPMPLSLTKAPPPPRPWLLRFIAEAIKRRQIFLLATMFIHKLLRWYKPALKRWG